MPSKKQPFVLEGLDILARAEDYPGEIAGQAKAEWLAAWIR